jgi:soluble lytic murein transglycosylase-like protein
MKRWVWLLASGLAWTWSADVPACWDDAAQRYQVNPRLLYAIAKCESDLRPNVINRSHRARTGTYDIGLMQINSSHLQRLSGYGIGEHQLADACTNIHVGAWILADKIQRHGLSWEAVGAYNAACTQLKGQDCVAARSRYAWCVYRNLSIAPATRLHSPYVLSLPAPAQPVPLIAMRVAP